MCNWIRERSHVGFAPQRFMQRLRIACVLARIRPSFFSNCFSFFAWRRPTSRATTPFNEPFPEHLTRTPTAPAGCASMHPPRPIDKGPAQPFAGAFLFLECAHMSAQRKARDDEKRLGRFYFSVPNAAPRNPVVAAMARRESSQGAGRHLRTHRAERRAQKVALQKAARGLGRED
jgi:hypothetical protein